MNGDVSLDLGLGDYLIYLTEGAFNRLRGNKLSSAERQTLESHARVAATRAGTVRCIGMVDPLPLRQIYQPVRLSVRAGTTPLAPLDLVEDSTNSIVLAGPGRGKTILLHWLYANLLESKAFYPLLFTLRKTDTVNQLGDFIAILERTKTSPVANAGLVLLLDGYDELSNQDRVALAEALERFVALGLGQYILSCRHYYELVGLHGRLVDLDDFSPADAEAFLTRFARAYHATFSPAELIRDLVERGFADFLHSPLLLTLLAILKTGKMPALERATIGVIQQALDVLSFRWDYEKGLTRSGEYNIPGREHLRCLRQIAYYMKQLEASEQAVAGLATSYLARRQRPDIEPRGLLSEMARFYGLLVPVENARWCFTHRTLHDYLAAQYWVESGRFSHRDVVTWDSRAAYAAALSPDATPCLVSALQNKSSIHAVVEMLDNYALYDVEPVVTAFINHLLAWPDSFEVMAGASGEVRARTNQDCFGSFSNDFLLALIRKCTEFPPLPKRLGQFLLTYCISELHRRGGGLDGAVRHQTVHALKGYSAVVAERRGPVGPHTVRLTDIR